MMAYEYYLATGSFEFLDEKLEFNGTSATLWELLQREYRFWETNRVVNVTAGGRVYEALHYSVKSNTPRPESYTFDIETASGFTDGNGTNLKGDSTDPKFADSKITKKQVFKIFLRCDKNAQK